MQNLLPSAMQGLGCCQAADSPGAAGLGDNGASDGTLQGRWGSEETAQEGRFVHPANTDKNAERK